MDHSSRGSGKSLLRKIGIVLLLLSILPSLSACQEFKISIEYPGGSAPALTNEGDPADIGTDPVYSDIDPTQYFFPDDALPQDISFSSEAVKTYLISYLTSPGKMTGIAFTRNYQAYYRNFSVDQVIIQSPYPIPLDMFKAGHHGEDLEPAPAEYRLGEGTLVNSVQNSEEREVRYRFYQNNIMVMVDLYGSDEFVSLDQAYQLAQVIAAQLPESFPPADTLADLPLAVQPGLKEDYFHTLQLVDCRSPHQTITTLPNSMNGLCAQTDILKPIRDFKLGLYAERYDKLIFIKDFLLPSQLGSWNPRILEGVWDLAWDEFPEGEYRVLFWVNGHLAASLPFAIGSQESSRPNP
jgi:hypothetical protein